MKVLYISQYYPPEIGAGPVRAHAITTFFKQIGWEVDVVCEFPNYPTGLVPSGYENKWTHTQKDGNLNVHQVKVYAGPRKTRLQQLLQFGSFVATSFAFCLKHMKQYDIIYASSPPLSSGITAALLSRITGIPWVFEVRDLWPEALLATHGSKTDSFFFRLLKSLEKRLYRSSAMIIAVTHASADKIRASESHKPVHVIHNGVDPDVFKPDNTADHVSLYEESPPDGSQKFRVGYVGSIGVIHDFEPVVRAAALCKDDPDIEFVIIGDGSQAHQLEELIELYQPGNIRWLGLKPYQEIPAYINSFDVGLNPIRDIKVFESIINVKFFEYLSCEVPVINLGRGTIKEIGDRSRSSVTLEPGDFEGLAATIRRLKEQPDEREQLRKNSRDFILQAFDRKQLSSELSELILAHLKYK